MTNIYGHLYSSNIILFILGGIILKNDVVICIKIRRMPHGNLFLKKVLAKCIGQSIWPNPVQSPMCIFSVFFIPFYFDYRGTKVIKSTLRPVPTLYYDAVRSSQGDFNSPGFI